LKKTKAPLSRKLALKKETLKDLTPQGRTAKGGALITPYKPITPSIAGCIGGSGGISGISAVGHSSGT
jgi:hypothetical protein